ncbi:MAG: phosphonate ABC transporter ATP-binding protein [Minwuia sp.]|uniref:phosphonate ABC transporter ATP-binding protein n=1 Tax=Minwuia sp. TaxID=2493630 RepID=UPI003A8960C2
MSAIDVNAIGAAVPCGGALLACTRLAKSYRSGQPVLDGVTLDVPAGQRVALIGANGSGKSTLLRCLIGLTPVSGGEILALGERFGDTLRAAQRARLRRQTGFVFQNHCLVRRRSVLSNVVQGMLGEPGSWRGFSQMTAPHAWREQAMEALDAVGLADRARARADQLSGGQQQRVAIARGLARTPKLLIADEPAASLDPAAGRDIMALFTRLVDERNLTLLFTTHDMEHAVSYADRIVGLKDGVIALNVTADIVQAADLARFFDG